MILLPGPNHNYGQYVHGLLLQDRGYYSDRSFFQKMNAGNLTGPVLLITLRTSINKYGAAGELQ